MHAVAVFVLLGAGMYAVCVLDHLVGNRVAGQSVRVCAAFAQPWQSAALELRTQRVTTERPDSALWALAPALLGAAAATAVATVPLGALGSGAAERWDVNAGIVLFGAAMALVMVAVYLNGWAANSAFSLIGAYRFVAQALSYEMPLALVLIAAALPAESLSVGAIVQSQASVWNIVRQPLGLPIYLIAGLGLAFWGPLATPDAQDLAGGTEVELSGPALLLWRAARAGVLVAVAAMGAAAFLGGPLGPWQLGLVWMAAKTLLLVLIMLWLGHRLARVRLEWFVRVAWTVLIPLALVDVFASGALVLWSR